MNTVNKVIDIAKSQVGYLEKASPDYLDDDYKNAGYNNYTKYARDLYNKIGSPFINGYAWCDTFINWCFVEAYGVDNAKKMLGGFSAYCPTSVDYFKKLNRWHDTAKIGDIIFFYDSSKDYGHVGIVYNIDSTNVYTIEGNTSSDSGVIANGGAVCEKTYNINYYRIAGYGRPPYEAEINYGWKQDDKGWWYVKPDGNYYKSCWASIDNKDYYFGKDGYMASDEYIKSADYETNKILYYVEKSGEWNGNTYTWKSNDKGWWLESETGWYPISEWCRVDNKWYYFDKKGYIVTGTIQIDGQKCKFGADGALII